MLGKLLGLLTSDRKVAEILLTYLVTFHRTYDRMGEDFLLGTIKRNPLVSGFTELSDMKFFFIEKDLGDFQFTYLVPQGAVKPAIGATGREIYRGLSVHVGLDDGKFMMFCDSGISGPPTVRAKALAQILSQQFKQA